jgi:hypothetical protein
MIKILALTSVLAVAFVGGVAAQTTGPIGQQDSNKVGPANPAPSDNGSGIARTDRQTDSTTSNSLTTPETVGSATTHPTAAPRTNGVDATQVAPAGR